MCTDEKGQTVQVAKRVLASSPESFIHRRLHPILITGQQVARHLAAFFFFFSTAPLGLWTRPTIHILKRALQDFGTARVIKAPNKSLLVEITAVRRETDDGRMELRTCQPFFPFFFPPPSPPCCLAGEVHVSGLLRGGITVGTSGGGGDGGDGGDGGAEDRRCRHL